MKTAVIRHRVADFLKQHAPFDSLPEADLLTLAGSGRVKFHESEEHIFQQGDAPGPLLFVIQQGRVELLEEHQDGERLRDVLGPGDLLGLDRFLGEGAQRHAARTASDVILYSVDAAMFQSLAASHAAVKRYLSAHFSVAGSSGVGRISWLDAEPPPASFLRARSVTTQHLCPPTAALPLTTRDAVRRMIAGPSDSLAITADGTHLTPVDCVLTADDLALFCGPHPVRLLQQIAAARSVEELAPLIHLARKMTLDALAHPDDVEDCALLTGAFTRAACDAAARLAHEEVKAAGIDCPPQGYCWLAFGPAARGELLRPGLPNLAVIYDDELGPDAAPWFAALAGETIGCLHACGLEGPGLVWPEGAQPCMPLSEWKRFYSETLRDPIGSGIYLRREFLDVVFLSGDRSLYSSLQDHMARELAAENDIVVPLLANDTFSHLPPLTFYRGIVLQLDGAQSNRFDLRKTGILPVADAARVFDISGGRVPLNTTLERLAAAALHAPGHASMFREAAEAFRIALYFEALSADPAIDPAELGRYDQRLLKTAFASIQRLLEFTIANFSE
jgi:signal-transduction protein with cAMP-binding, CBS, and nucleotidyltransferase domain